MTGDPFFKRGRRSGAGAGGGRKRSDAPDGGGSRGKRRRRAEPDDDGAELDATTYNAAADALDGDDADGAGAGGVHRSTFLAEELGAPARAHGGDDDADGDSDDGETAAEKRVRIAKQYIDRLQQTQGRVDDVDAAEIDRENIAARLRQDALLVTGKLKQELADKIAGALDVDGSRFLRGHRLALTAVVVAADEKVAFTASKEGLIIKWDLATGQRLIKLAAFANKAERRKDRHTDHVVALALSSDGRFLASGGLDKVIHVWDAADLTHRGAFPQHRGPISGLVFRQGSHQLYSASHDRTLKTFDLDQMAFIETLYGHQETVTAIDCLARERCVSAGGRDRTARLWKIAEESQLVFRGQAGSMDAIRLINDEYFLTGDDAGALSLWSVNKKKPVAQVPQAHGPGHWIVSLATIPFADVVATGSSDGFVRLWKVSSARANIELVGQITQPGFVNALCFAPSGKLLLVATGQEHRMGRWQRLPEGKNLLRIVPIRLAGTTVLSAASAVPAVDDHHVEAAEAPRPAAAAAAPNGTGKGKGHGKRPAPAARKHNPAAGLGAVRLL